METLTVQELQFLLSIPRDEAKEIIEAANEDLFLTEFENEGEEKRFELYKRNFAPYEYINRIVETVNSLDPRYHGRTILDIIIEGLGKGLSLRMKLELKNGVNYRKNKTLLKYSSAKDKQVFMPDYQSIKQ